MTKQMKNKIQNYIRCFPCKQLKEKVIRHKTKIYQREQNEKKQLMSTVISDHFSFK